MSTDQYVLTSPVLAASRYSGSAGAVVGTSTPSRTTPNSFSLPRKSYMSKA